MHGAHKSRQEPSDENHWNYQHGKATKKKRAKDALSAIRLLLLRDLGFRPLQPENITPESCVGKIVGNLTKAGLRGL